MRHFCKVLVAALAVAVYVVPAAGADALDKGRGGAVVTPNQGKLVADAWAHIYSLSPSENPFFGNGNPCVPMRHHVMWVVGGGHCTVEQGTAIMFHLGSAWSNVEDPFPQTEAAQRAVALAADQGVSEFHAVIDGEPVDMLRPRFELFTPQRTVQLPEDNIFDDPDNQVDIPAQTITLTAHAWSGVVRNLRPGVHTIVGEGVWDGYPFEYPHTVTVVRRGHAN